MKPTQEQVIAWALKCGASIKTDCNGNGAFGSGVDLNELATLAYEAGRKDAREWQGLTDEERTYLAWESNNGLHCVAMTEAKLKEKNT